MIVRTYKLDLIIIKSEVWHICHCLWLGHETIVCAVCLSIFLRYFLLDIPKRHPIASCIDGVAYCLTCSLHVISCCNRPIMMSLNGNNFCVNGPVWGESIGHLWFPSQTASRTDLWCFLWCTPRQTVEQTVESLMIRDAVSVMWRHYTDIFHCALKPGWWYKMCPLVWVTACHLFAPSHKLNKCWLIANSEKKMRHWQHRKLSKWKLAGL